MDTHHPTELSITLTIPVNAPRSLTLDLTLNVPDLIEDENGVRHPVKRTQEPNPEPVDYVEGDTHVHNRTMDAIGIPDDADDATSETEPETESEHRPQLQNQSQPQNQLQLRNQWLLHGRYRSPAMPAPEYNFDSVSSSSNPSTTLDVDSEDEFPEDKLLRLAAARATADSSLPTASTPPTASTSMNMTFNEGMDALFPNHNAPEQVQHLVPYTTFPSNGMYGSMPLSTILPQFSSVVKSVCQFSSNTEIKFDHYCETVDVQERHALQYALTLEMRDILKDMHRPDNWTVSDDLKKNIASYTKLFLLSPTITAYRGNCAEQVLTAMRAFNVGGLPPAQSVVQVGEVLSVISSHLTTFRAVMKAKIQASLVPPKGKAADTRNVANLAHALIAHTGVPATLQLWMRIAFLRFNFASSTNGDFWKVVDDALERFRTRGKTSQQISVMFNEVYAADIKKYGDPAQTKHQLCRVEKLPPWFKTVENLSSKVMASVSTASVAQGKRRRVDSDAEENE